MLCDASPQVRRHKRLRHGGKKKRQISIEICRFFLVEQNEENPNSKSSDFLDLVEVRGVEPLSENHFTEFSPGAVGYCGRRYRPVPLTAGKPTRRQVG